MHAVILVCWHVFENASEMVNHTNAVPSVQHLSHNLDKDFHFTQTFCSSTYLPFSRNTSHRYNLLTMIFFSSHLQLYHSSRLKTTKFQLSVPFIQLQTGRSFILHLFQLFEVECSFYYNNLFPQLSATSVRNENVTHSSTSRFASVCCKPYRLKLMRYAAISSNLLSDRRF